MATGYAALAAADVVDAGGSVEEGAEAARRRAELATSLFYVDTLEYLRRGGRIGATAALLGGALSVKPLLRIDDGRVVTPRAGPHHRSGPDPARGPRGRGGRRRGRGRRASPTSPTPTAPASSRAGSASAWPTTSRAARCGAASWARCSARTSDRAWSRPAWHRASSGPLLRVPRGRTGSCGRPADRPQEAVRLGSSTGSVRRTTGVRSPFLASPHAQSPRLRPRSRRRPAPRAPQRRARTVRGEGPRPRLRVAGVDESPDEAPDDSLEPGAEPGRRAGRRAGADHWRPGGATRVRAPGMGRSRRRRPGPSRCCRGCRGATRRAARCRGAWSWPEPLRGRWSLGGRPGRGAGGRCRRGLGARPAGGWSAAAATT